MGLSGGLMGLRKENLLNAQKVGDMEESQG